MVLVSILWSGVVSDAADSVESKPGASVPSATSATAPSVRARILDLVKEEAKKIPQEAKVAAAPFLNPGAPANSETVEEGVLVLERFRITKKREMELPVIPKLTLENFYYGEGTFWQGKRSSLHAAPVGIGPDGESLIGIKWKIKF
jgi:hypothetical protein